MRGWGMRIGTASRRDCAPGRWLTAECSLLAGRRYWARRWTYWPLDVQIPRLAALARADGSFTLRQGVRHLRYPTPAFQGGRLVEPIKESVPLIADRLG